MTWLAALIDVENAVIYTTVGIVLPAVVAWVKVVRPHLRAHRAAQQAILANQKTILGDRFEAPTH